MTLKPILELGALILSLVNGLVLLRGYLRDRPILRVTAEHPDTYQWFFRLPGGQHQGQTTRRYGFLAYIGILNKGRRDVSISSWRLYARTQGGKRFEQRAMSILEPEIEIQGCYKKIYPVLGVRGLQFQGDTMVKSGASIAGFCYYVVELWGSSNWDLLVKDGTTAAEIVVKSVFGSTAKLRIAFHEISLEKVNAMIPGIENVGETVEESLGTESVAPTSGDAAPLGEG